MKLAEPTDHAERRVVEFTVERGGAEQSEWLPGADGEQRGGADDLSGPQIGAQTGLLQRRGVFEAQPVQRTVQVEQPVAFVRTGRAFGRHRGCHRTAARR